MHPLDAYSAVLPMASRLHEQHDADTAEDNQDQPSDQHRQQRAGWVGVVAESGRGRPACFPSFHHFRLQTRFLRYGAALADDCAHRLRFKIAPKRHIVNICFIHLPVGIVSLLTCDPSFFRLGGVSDAALT